MISIKNNNKSNNKFKINNDHFSNLIKGEIPAHKRKFYLFNNRNELEGYKHIISIDTINIKMKLEQEHLNYLLSTYEYKSLHYNPKELYKYKIENSDHSIYIKLLPMFPARYFNTEIQIQKQFNNDDNKTDQLTLDVLSLLNLNQDYWISRLDVAFDYLIPFSHSFSLKRHGNQTRRAIGDEYLFTGSTKNKNKEIVHSHYNRNNKEPSKVEYSNRFECKMFFQRKDKMRFNNINDRLIIKRLKKEIFVADINHISDISADEKALLLASKDKNDENILQVQLPSKEYTKLRKKVVRCREPLEQIYIENAHMIYDFLLTTNLDDI